MITLATGFGVAWWGTSRYPLVEESSRPVHLASMVAGIVLGGAFVWWLAAGSERALRTAAVVGVVLPGALGGIGAFQVLNGALDRAPAHTTRYSALGAGRRDKDPAYYLAVAPAGHAGPTLNLAVSRADYEWTPRGSSVDVYIRPGALRAPWVAGYAVVRRTPAPWMVGFPIR